MKMRDIGGQCLASAWERDDESSLMLIDMDSLKGVNGAAGSLAGKALLKATAARPAAMAGMSSSRSCHERCCEETIIANRVRTEFDPCP